jgi:hypothetical protein
MTSWWVFKIKPLKVVVKLEPYKHLQNKTFDGLKDISMLKLAII